MTMNKKKVRSHSTLKFVVEVCARFRNRKVKMAFFNRLQRHHFNEKIFQGKQYYLKGLVNKLRSVVNELN